MNIIVAERRFVVSLIDSGSTEVRLVISRPEKVADDTWSCSAALEGLEGQHHDTIGLDSWQALTVAIALIRQSIVALQETGATFHWTEGGEALHLDDLFPLFD